VVVTLQTGRGLCLLLVLSGLPGGALDLLLGGLGEVAKLGRRSRLDISVCRLLLSGLLLSGSLLLLVLGVGVAVEEEIDHDIPRLRALDGATDAQNLTGKEPVHETDRETALVVAGDGNIDVVQRAVSAAESNDREVAVASLADGLVVRTGISGDEKTGLSETLLDLVSEGTGSVTTSNGLDTKELGKLEDGTLTVLTRGNNNNVTGVLNAGYHTSSKHKLLPGGLHVDDVHTVSTTLVHVRLHARITVHGTDMRLAGKEHADILLRDIHALWDLRHIKQKKKKIRRSI